MGRFETTVDFYPYREPYPPTFFERIATYLHFTPETRLLDVACGPGNLAIGFAPFVGQTIAIDLEAEMLRAARLNAQMAGVDVKFQQVPVEELALEPASIDLVTVGRALHWLQPGPTLAVFERVIDLKGVVAVCGATTSDSTPWIEPFRRIRRAWADAYEESRYRPDLDAWFAPSAFRKVNEISVTHRHHVTVDHLIARALSYSVTSPALLGERRADFETAMRAELQNFATGEVLEEEIVASAALFSRVH